MWFKGLRCLLCSSWRLLVMKCCKNFYLIVLLFALVKWLSSKAWDAFFVAVDVCLLRGVAGTAMLTARRNFTSWKLITKFCLQQQSLSTIPCRVRKTKSGPKFKIYTSKWQILEPNQNLVCRFSFDFFPMNFRYPLTILSPSGKSFIQYLKSKTHQLYYQLPALPLTLVLWFIVLH